MSDVTGMAVARLSRVHRTHARIRRQTLTLIAMTLSASLVTLLFAEAYRDLAAPVLAVATVAAIYLAVLWNRDRRLPIFEVGTLWVVSTTLYSTVPLLGFMAMGLQWSPWTDGRLVMYDFNVREIASFGWRSVVYLAAFVVVYLAVRGRVAARSTPLEPVRAQFVAAIVLILLFQGAFKSGVAYAYGLGLDVSYSDLGVVVVRMAQVPQFILQVTLIVLASILLVKQALLLVAIQQWRSLRWRIALLAWLAIEVVIVVVRMGPRGQAVRLLLTFGVLYDRFVRPIRARWVVVSGSLVLVGFLVQGNLRASWSLHELSLSTVLTSANEFQSLFATTFDIYQRKKVGTLGPVPWQVYVSDLYILIPRQLLPFEKIDPSEWYLGVLGARGTGVGFMFGVMSQAILGLDWIELVLRGALLGLLLAGLHRWYVRHARNLWPTLLYLFIAIWSYYTFRATTFWLVHFIVYQFVPVMVSAKVIEYALSRSRTAKIQPAAA